MHAPTTILHHLRALSHSMFLHLLLTGLDKGECSESDLHKAKGMVPKSLASYVDRKYT
jgi:hypothetical protein